MCLCGNKIISNITTAHISYNNIIYTQVDLSDTNSVRFIGYNSNGILNYYALNKSTGTVQTMNTYNIGKTFSIAFFEFFNFIPYCFFESGKSASLFI